ncbi:NAD-dependent deacylase [Tessaracoccus sp. OH4464_COT-324]|uniref:NAD-dependent deacylase n=1 Tax=Tessaracoccus sp. OH4464_COT-324 TaxID=2491059 RepID=UPI000F642EE4|nr:NAD-dependent deacylase [Tessaracoccus sp. OH4464_COT-324]RRD46867.1 NAD-dependent deacylase [Tessaracoccus sp. OH4464_COT-324]
MARIVILTGAGISAESGIPTFRASDGLWENYPVWQVATPQAFASNPALVHRFYNERRAKLLSPEVQPNPAHLALARLAEALPGQVCIVTQNIDDLHERAGSPWVIHMHGELLTSWCLACEGRMETLTDVDEESVCPLCGEVGRLRPNIVWFEEIPYSMDEIHRELMECEIFVSIGTSGNVYPAAGFVALAAAAGAHTVELNLESSLGASYFDECRQGPASQVVPEWVDEVLTASKPA